LNFYKPPPLCILYSQASQKYSGIEENGLAAKYRVGGITVSSVKDPICASRQGLHGITSRWESKRDQREGKQGYRDNVSNVI